MRRPLVYYHFWTQLILHVLGWFVLTQAEFVGRVLPWAPRGGVVVLGVLLIITLGLRRRADPMPAEEPRGFPVNFPQRSDVGPPAPPSASLWR